ncbi:MAG: hypothetical protein EAZ27_01590, partial [Cytophagales bacterium]
LIGGNGSGKSNFISFFKLLNSIFSNQLQKYIIEQKADNILYFGRKKTNNLYGKFIYKNQNHNNAYSFQLAQTNDGGLFIEKEGSGFNVEITNIEYNYFYNTNLLESKFASDKSYRRNQILQQYVSNFKVFHFHDTSSTSFLRRECAINDNLFLRKDGRNLAAFLYVLKIKHSKVYNRILKTVQSIAPYISDLVLEPNKLNEQEIELRWIDSGDLDSSFSAYQLSDGTLRFIALATLLMQPNLPSVIIIDEPELGLHPFAIQKLSGIIQLASTQTQIIIATQSSALISCFLPKDIIVVDKSETENQSIFKRLNENELKEWLSDYSLGDLWERNIINAAQPFAKR